MSNKKTEKKPLFKVTLTINPVGGDFFGSSEQVKFEQLYSMNISPLEILEMAHFQYYKNCALDPDLKKLNDGKI